MLDEEDEDGNIEVRFLQKAHKIDNARVDPVDPCCACNASKGRSSQTGR